MVSRRICPWRQRRDNDPEELKQRRLAGRRICPHAVQFGWRQAAAIERPSQIAGISEEGRAGRRRNGEGFWSDANIRPERGEDREDAPMGGEHKYLGALGHLEEPPHAACEVRAE